MSISTRVKTFLASRYGGVIIPFLLFVLAFAPRIVALSHFITVDEPIWMNRVARFGVALLSNNLSETYAPTMLDGGGPGVTTMWVGFIGLILEYLKNGATGGLGAFLSLYTDGLPAPAILPALRIATVLITSLTLPLLYMELKGWLGAGVAALGAVLLAMDPFYTAHSRVLHHDALVTAFMALSLTFVLVALWHRFSLVRLAFAGGMASLALLSKLMGGFAIPFSLAMFIAAYLWSPVFRTSGNGAGANQPGLGPFSRLVTGVSVWALSLIAVFVAFTPGMWTEPLALLKALFLRGMQMSEGGHFQFFRGVVSFDPGPLFYCAVLPLRTTPVSFVGLLLSLLVVTGLPIRALRESVRDRSQMVFARLALLVVIFFPLLLITSPKKQDRYLLPIFPWIDFLAAIGWLTFIRILGQWRKVAGAGEGKWHFGAAWAHAALWIGVSVFQLQSLVYDAPYYLGYYNPLFGGPAAAARTLLVGWGDGLDEVGRYLDSKPNAQDLVVSAVPAIGLRPYFSGHVLDFYTNYSGCWADYVVTYISQCQRHVPDQEQQRYFDKLEVEHVASRHGLPYAYIYKGAQCSDSPTHIAEVNFGGLFRVSGFDVITSTQQMNGLQIRLFWQSLARTEEDYTWSLRLRDHTGHQWAQADFRPMDGALPTNLWRPGSTVVSDNQTLELPVGMPPGRYTLSLLAYELATMESLPVIEPSGDTAKYLADIGTVVVAPPPTPVKVESLPLAARLDLDLTSAIRLIGFAAGTDGAFPIESSPGEEAVVTLYWQAFEDVHQDYRVRLKLVDSAEEVAFRQEQSPHSGAYPTNRWRQGEIIQDRHYLRVPAELEAGTYLLELALIDSDTGQQASPPVTLGELVVSGRPHMFERPMVQYQQTAEFGGLIRLLGYDLSGAGFQPNDTLRVTLYWQAMGHVPGDYQVFVHVLDDNSTVRAQHDGTPGLGSSPTSSWLPGEFITDIHDIALPADMPVGVYRLSVGLYALDNGERLRLTGADWAGEGDSVFLEQPIHVLP